jgi:hypothetical protein
MDPKEGQARRGFFVNPEDAARIGLQNWHRSYLPRTREQEVLEAAGIPARGPVAAFAPSQRGVTPPSRPDRLYRKAQNWLFGTVHQPRTFESRWLGVQRDTGSAMRSPDPTVGPGGRSVQPMSLELYGGNREQDPRFAFSNPFSQQVIRSAGRAEEARRAGPGFQDSWARVDPHVLWGLDEPGRYGIQRPYFRGQ